MYRTAEASRKFAQHRACACHNAKRNIAAVGLNHSCWQVSSMLRYAPLRLISCAVLFGTAAFGLAPNPAAAAFTGVHHVVTTVNGLSVDQYSWYDSHRLLRTVSLKQEGNGNPGHGGYAVQMTYQHGASTITVNAESSNDGGFGYFVSHERYRTFTDGD